jgi:hypothetical protein
VVIRTQPKSLLPPKYSTEDMSDFDFHSSQLRLLAYDMFPSVYKQFTNDTSKAQATALIVQELIKFRK